MTETTVSFLLGKLGPFLEGEEKLLREVRGEIEYIKDELEFIRAFSRVADSVKETYPLFKIWVDQVREIAYNIEDVIDEFNFRLTRDQIGGFYSFIRRVSSCIKNLKYRHQIATQLQGIKSRVKDISERQQRYLNKFEDTKQGSSSTSANKTWQELQREEVELVGLNKPKKKLIGWLVEDDSNVKVISVVGIGGVGKSTLVKKVYDDAQVKKHFKSHAWINVSQSFKIEELLRKMISQLFDEVEQEKPNGVENMTIQRLIDTTNEFLKQRRFMIVLDDVWHMEALNAIKYAFPQNNSGSRVMLTTRIAKLASTISSVESNSKIHNLEPLSIKDSWTLFCRKTFQCNKCPPPWNLFCRKTFQCDKCPTQLKNVSIQILKRCEGVPLAIVAISGMLAKKDKSRIDEWEMVDRSLGAELEGNDKLLSMMKILSISVNDLPYNLTACFMYLSIFPEDYEIEQMRLIRL